jgi:hypothetical protein
VAAAVSRSAGAELVHIFAYSGARLASTTVLGLLSAVPLIGHLLAPRLYARLREWMYKAFLPEPRTELTLMRNTAQSQGAVHGLLTGFAPRENAERVASVLVPAGLTRGFAGRPA